MAVWKNPNEACPRALALGHALWVCASNPTQERRNPTQTSKHLIESIEHVDKQNPYT